MILLLLMALAASCSPQASAPTGQSRPPADARPTRMRAALGEDVVTLSSRFVNTRNRLDAVINAFLVQTDDRWSLFPGLVQSIPTQDDGTWIVNPDGTMRMIWTL